MMYYICECGASFNEYQEGACEHVLEEHLDLVESRFDEFVDEANSDPDGDVSDGDLYDEAIDDVTDELLDAFEDN